jgi:adenine deaminase
MLVPSEFARVAVRHGSVATVSDPHEIANVMAIQGVNFMIDNAEKVPFKFYFGAPSCVPATAFETAGAELGVQEIEELLSNDKIKYLSEMMNFPGVIYKDETVIEKLAIAHRYNKPVDGHAPGVKGEDLIKYAAGGITTDHESTNIEEAKEKINLGMKTLIREGSAAKNYDALVGLMEDNSDMVMFCSDDKHPHELINGHINELVVRTIKKGYDLFDVLKSTIVNPIKHYNLDVGMLRIGDPADFIVVENLEDFKVKATYIDGVKVAENGKDFIERVEFKNLNRFDRTPISARDIEFKGESGEYRVIEVIDGELWTKEGHYHLEAKNGIIDADIEHDILKIVVLSRYNQEPPAIAWIKNFGFKKGAIASSVAHDSHNIIAVGTNDTDLLNAINTIINHKGGLALCEGENNNQSIVLPVAGLMSDLTGDELAVEYSSIHKKSLKLGSTLHDPFMMLSFCALLVIPELKLSDKGLFNGINFIFTPSNL